MEDRESFVYEETPPFEEKKTFLFFLCVIFSWAFFSCSVCVPVWRRAVSFLARQRPSFKKAARPGFDVE